MTVIHPAAGSDGQTFAAESIVMRYVNLVKLPHTVFALPFALLGVVYASDVSSVTWPVVGLVLVAFTAARFAAMGFNRLIDREFDRLNPRTAARELPRGRLRPRAVAVSVVIAALVFVAAAAGLNRLCLLLSPVALAWVLAYSFTKRFTAWSHLWLGGSLAIAPVGGYLAVVGAWSSPWWTLLVLAVAVFTWVAGFDMFYALQDEQFDRAHGLRSAVVRWGAHRTVLMAKLLHGVTILALVTFGYGVGWGAVYFGSIVVAAGILAWEHRLVDPHDLTRLDAAFFTMNGIMSLVVFAGALGDRWL